jgi:beta-hydroxylase
MEEIVYLTAGCKLNCKQLLGLDKSMEIRHIIFLIFAASAVYVYFRGKVRFGIVRALTDYQVLLAPVNTPLYLFSKVKASTFIPVS